MNRENWVSHGKKVDAQEGTSQAKTDGPGKTGQGPGLLNIPQWVL